MSTFEPTVQTPNSPEWWYWAHSAQQPESDKSTGIALKTGAEAIEGAATIADRAMKENIATNTREKVENQQDQFIQALQASQGKSTVNNPMDAMDLMPDNNQPPKVPAAINTGLATVGKLQNSLSGNKITETYYYQNLYQTLKDVRAQYPGYTDYVDSEVSKITGVNPANAYMKGMISDINSQRTKAAAEQSYYEKQLVNSGFSGSQDMLNGLKSGSKSIAQVQQYLAANNERSEALKQKIANFTLADKTRSDYQAKAEIGLQSAAEHASTEYFHNKALINSQDAKTSSQIDDYMAGVTAGTIPKDADQIRQYATQLEMLRARNYQETDQLIHSVKNSDGVSLYDVVGPAKAKEIMDASIGKLYDTMQKSLTNQDIGLVHAVQNSVKDVGSNAAFKLQKDGQLGPVVQVFQGLNQLAPNLSPELMSSMVGKYGSSLVGQGGSGDIGVDLLNFSTHLGRQAITQLPEPNTLSDAGKKLSDGAQATASDPATEAKGFKQLLDLSDAIHEKDPRVQQNAISFFFSPKNKGSLDKLMDDYYDPNRGYVIAGRTAAFSQLTAEKNTVAIKRFADKFNPQAWDWYKGWANNEAGAHLTGMAKAWTDSVKEVNNEHTGGLGSFNLRNILGVGTDKSLDHQFHYNSETHQLGLIDSKGRELPVSSWRLNQSLFAFRNANKYFDSLANIAKAEGTDPNVMIFRSLQQAWPLDAESQKIFKAIMTATGKPPKTMIDEP